MNMDTKLNSKSRVIRLQGAILRKDAERLEGEFSSLEISEYKNIILDLSRVNHICSSALGVFVTFKRKLKHREGELKLVINDDDIRQVFEITMLDKVFEIYKDIDDAISSFN